jgi:hypothetical protein
MILSEAVLNKIEYYEAERLNPTSWFTQAMTSKIRLHWKKSWWQFWKFPSTISIHCICNSIDGDDIYYADPEWEELAEQLRDYFSALAPKTHTAKLIMIKGGKDE